LRADQFSNPGYLGFLIVDFDFDFDFDLEMEMEMEMEMEIEMGNWEREIDC